MAWRSVFSRKRWSWPIAFKNISEPLQKTVELEEIRKKMRNPPQTDDEKEETFEKIKKWKTISFMARYCVKQNKSRLRGHGIG